MLLALANVAMITKIAYVGSGGTDVSGLTRGFATLLPRWIQEPLVVRVRDGRPQKEPLTLHCSVCIVVVHCWEILG